MRISTKIPIVSQLKTYSGSKFRSDLSAGLTVGVMLVPQGMAYAMIAGLPPIYGLYASTLPIIIYAVFGSSRQLAVGPVAMVSLLTASSVGLMADGGTELYILLALTLAMLVGFIQFLLGIFRLGFLVNFLSHPVISGFTSAAALIIGLSQLKHLLGIDIPRSHHVHETLIYAVNHMASTHWTTMAIGVGGILLIKFLKHWNKSIPGPLILVASSIILVRLFNLETAGVQIVGDVPSGLPTFLTPSFSMLHINSLLPAALAIALVSFMESIAVAKAIQARHKDYIVRANQELIALGLANIGGSFFQSYPVTGGFSRTAVNDQSGAKTTVASIIAALLIVLTLLFFTPMFYYLPNAVLASVIMVAVFGLIDITEAKKLWKFHRNEFWMLVATFVGTLTLGIEQGIGLGIILSLAMVLYKSSRPHVAQLGELNDTGIFRNVIRYENAIVEDDTLITRFDDQLYFINETYFKEIHDHFIHKKGKQLKQIIINAAAIHHIDSSALHMLSDFVEQQRSNNIEVYFTGLRGPVRDVMTKTAFDKKVGKEYFFHSIHQAIESIKQNHQASN